MQFLIFVLTATFTFCTSGLATIQPPFPDQQGIQQSKSSPELAEVDRINLTVRKLYSEGKYDEALPLAKRVLDISQQNLSPDDEHIAPSLVTVANIYEAEKRLGEAQLFLERALAFYEKKFGVGDSRVAMVLDRLGSIYFSRSHYPESELALNRSLAIKEKLYAVDSPSIVTSLDNLAQFYRYRGDAKKAEPVFERALKIIAKQPSPDSPPWQKTKDHYFCMLNELGRTGKLKELERERAEQAAAGVLVAAEAGAGVLNGKALKLPLPEWPASLQKGGVDGVVVVTLTIDETGKVIEAHDLCGANPLLAKASIAAAYKAQFTPTKMAGQPVKVTGRIVYNFVRR
jgi:TonB family protein